MHLVLGHKVVTHISHKQFLWSLPKLLAVYGDAYPSKEPALPSYVCGGCMDAIYVTASFPLQPTPARRNPKPLDLSRAIHCCRVTFFPSTSSWQLG